MSRDHLPSAHTHARRAALRPLRLRQVPPRRPLRSAGAAPRRLLQGGQRPDAAAGAGQHRHRLGLTRSPGTRTRRSPRSRSCAARVVRTSRCTTSPLSARTGEEALDIERTPAVHRGGHLRGRDRRRAAGSWACWPTRCACAGARSRRSAGGFLRDLREGRKSVPFLLRRGWRLMRAERRIVARQTALGAYPCDKDEALGRLGRGGRGAAGAAAGRRVRRRTPTRRR